MTQSRLPQAADLLIDAACIVTVDPARRVLRDHAIAVLDGRILAIGPQAEMAAAYRADKTLHAPKGLVVPGLIDGHNHTLEGFMKGLCDDTPQMVRLRDRVMPAEYMLSPEQAHIASLATFAEMIRNGTTTFVDAASPQPMAVAKAAADIGIRGIITRRTNDLPGPFGEYEAADVALEKLDATIEALQGLGAPLLRAALNMDAVAQVSDHLMAEIARRQAASDLNVVGHFVAMRPAPGATVPVHHPDMDRLHHHALLGPHAMYTHIAWVPEADFQRLAQTGTHVAHCPLASLVGGLGWVAHGVIPGLMAAGTNVILGSDAGTISRSVDMVRVMHAAATAYKDACRDPLMMNPYQVFEMVTIRAAKALRWHDTIGSIEVGKAADLAIFDTGSLDWWPDPLANPVPDLIYSGSGRDAQSVVINGRVVMENRVIAGIDLGQLGTELLGVKRDIFGRLGYAPSGQWPQ